MIELLWRDIYDKEFDPMMFVSNLIAWLATNIAEQEKEHHIKLTGYIVVRENETTISSLITCLTEEDQKDILKILMNPPDEYKDKFTARVPCEEPVPVMEKDDDSCEVIVETDSESEGEI